MAIVIQAKSSSGGSYDVHFDREPLRVFCECRAGVNRQLCKHKRAFINGDESMLADRNQANELRTVTEWLQGSEIVAAEADLTRVEAEKARIAREEKKLKSRLAALLDGGAG